MPRRTCSELNMGEQWQLVNIDKNEGKDVEKSSELFLSPDYDTLMRLMIPPGSPHPHPVNQLEIHNPNDALPGSWAGDRLIWLGSAGDLPEGVITPHEAQRLKEIAKTGTYLEKDTYGREHPECLLHGRILSGSVTKPLPSVRMYQLPVRHLMDPNIVWALRNLTKKEFVRSNGIPTYCAIGNYSMHLSYNRHKGYHGCPGLGQVLFLRTRWSGDPEDIKTANLQDVFPRGDWAGDRFDMRVYEDVAEDMTLDGWSDSTRPMARAIYALYKRLNLDDFVGEFREEPGEDEDPYNSDDEVFSEDERSEDEEPYNSDGEVFSEDK